MDGLGKIGFTQTGMTSLTGKWLAIFMAVCTAFQVPSRVLTWEDF